MTSNDILNALMTSLTFYVIKISLDVMFAGYNCNIKWEYTFKY